MKWMIVDDAGSNGWMLKFIMRQERQNGRGLGRGCHFDKSRCCASYVHCYEGGYMPKSGFSRGKHVLYQRSYRKHKRLNNYQHQNAWVKTWHDGGYQRKLQFSYLLYFSSFWQAESWRNDPLCVWFVAWVQICTGFRWYELQKTREPHGPCNIRHFITFQQSQSLNWQIM